MKRLYIIGNGFDLHHGLPTSYWCYKEYLKTTEPEFVDRFDDFIERYVIPNVIDRVVDIENWSELESYTKFIYGFDVEEILEEALASAEDDMDRASYWHDIQYMSDKYSEWINGIRTSFSEWIKTIKYSPNMKDKDLHIDKNAMYLNFNYTDTLEVLYEVPHKNILHIHGNLSGDIIFGNNEIPEDVIESSLLEIDTHEDADWRISEASEILNSVLKQTKLYYKDTFTQINKNKRFFEQIKECEEIIIMGFGFGDEDDDYMDEIAVQVGNLKRIKVYYHKEKDIENFKEKLLGKIKVQTYTEYIEW